MLISLYEGRSGLQKEKNDYMYMYIYIEREGERERNPVQWYTVFHHYKK